MMTRIYSLTSAALMFAISMVLVTEAYAGDKNSFWVREQSALFQAGFDGTACSKLPLPGGFIDGQTNCIRAPQTYLYKKTEADGTTTKEVRRMEDTYDESCVRGIDTAGNPTETCSISVVSGPSADINFTRKQNFSIVGTAWGDGESASKNRGTTSIGLAAARRSTQEIADTE